MPVLSKWLALNPPWVQRDFPKRIRRLEAWYDTSDLASMIVDGSNRVSLLADKSGNSAVNCLCLNGASGNYGSRPNAAAIQITGDIDMRALVALNDWTPTANQMIMSKCSNSGQYSYQWFLTGSSGGNIRFSGSANGTTFTLDAFSTVSVSTVVADFDKIWIRHTRIAATGLNRFYTSPDGQTWTQLGADVTATSGTIFSGADPLEIGSNTAGTANLMSGRVYRAQIYNGIAGTLAFDANFSLPAKLASSFTESSANAATVTINTGGDTGARICGERDLYQGTVSKQPVYLAYAGTKYGYLNGASGNYYSTPDSVALSITGDIDLRARIALSSWTPATTTFVIAKRQTNSAYRLGVNTDGTLAFMWSADGTVQNTKNSTAAVTGTPWIPLWIRAAFDVDNGVSGNTVTFYTSTDGTNWTQLGAPVVTAGVTSIADTGDGVEFGTQATGTTAGFIGKYYRAQIYNGINGTLAFDFNPAAYTSGTTFLDSSSNAATITINGGATIVTRTCLYGDGVDDYMKAAAFALPQPNTIYFVGQPVSFTDQDRVFAGNDSGVQAFQNTTTPNMSIYAGSTVATNTGFLVAVPAILSVVFNGALSLSRVNRAPAATGNAGTGNMNGFTLFALPAPSNFVNATVSEITIYSAANDVAAQDRFALYAGRKWSIAI